MSFGYILVNMAFGYTFLPTLHRGFPGVTVSFGYTLSPTLHRVVS